MSDQVLAFQTPAQGCGSAIQPQQVAGLSGEHGLMEMVRELLRRPSELRGRLAEFFDRTTDRSRTCLTTEKPVAVEFRKHAETLFLMETKNV